jgi:regulation of enolase protein 1 (concanavalin A-like superfamily)
LLEVHSAFYGGIADEAKFFAQMIEARRLVVRLQVKGLYGVLLDQPPGT